MTVTLEFPALGLAGLGLAAVLYGVLRWWFARRPPALPAAGRPGGLEITAVMLLLAGGFLLLAGWVVGCVLLWLGPRWRWPEKLAGTLVWPGGLAGVAFAAAAPAGARVCAGTGWMRLACVPAAPRWAHVTVLVVLLAGQVAVAVWLLLRAARRPGQDTAPAALPGVPVVPVRRRPGRAGRVLAVCYAAPAGLACAYAFCLSASLARPMFPGPAWVMAPLLAGAWLWLYLPVPLLIAGLVHASGWRGPAGGGLPRGWVRWRWASRWKPWQRAARLPHGCFPIRRFTRRRRA